MGRLFGTDGVRGVANGSELTPELAFGLGRVAMHLSGRGTHEAQTGPRGPRPRAIIGKDTRASGDMLEAALAAGICSVGGDVTYLGVVTTPTVAYLTRTMQDADLGVMISASHNPAEDNGIKFFSRDGFKLPDEVEDRLEAMVREIFRDKDRLETLSGEASDTLPRPTGGQIGRIDTSHDAADRYLEHLAGTIPVGLSGLKIVVDCSNGSAYRMGPRLLERLGARVIALNTAPDGNNINLDCGSTHPGPLQRAVREFGAHAGIAFDGDADRCIAVDEKGNLVHGDHILAICGTDLHRRGLLANRIVVATVLSNMGLEHCLRRFGIRLIRSKVGDRYVLEEMQRSGAVLGGEQSGHVIFLRHNTTGDGLLTAIQALSVMVETGRSLSELAAMVEEFPQIQVNIRVRSKDGLAENERIARALRRAEEALGDSGRILVRPSGTEPKIRVMVEGQNDDLIQRLAHDLKAVIETEMGE